MQEEPQILDKKGINNRVKVAIRIRPFIEREKVINDCSCIQVVSQKQIILGNQKLFKFDKVLDENSPQSQVYDSCVRGLVSQCFQGYNSAILAYGQTGSGKTFTMGTTSSKKIPYQDRGILPRVIQNIFQEVSKNGPKYRYSIKATFLQIYNEHIIDLLSEDHANTKANKENNMIAIRQEKDGSVTIYGANQEELFSVQDMLQLLDRGSFHRTTSSTLMNEASSRSHAIFTISIERNSVDFNNETGIDENYVTSKFVFVDLAGSQRLKKTGATGNTLKQGININLGLLELGNVISSLAIEKKQSKYINYRNSKLTRILQDSLGGNSNTYMIACVSPAQSNYEQSLNTIKYASKAMNIKNKPVINRDPQQAHILKLRGIINDLQKQNGELKKLMSQKGIDVSKFPSAVSQRAQNLTYMSQSQQISRLKTKNAILQKKCESLLIQNKQETKKSNQLQIALYQARRNKDILQIKIQKLLKGESISQDETLYTPIIESYLNKIQFLQSQIHQKQKSISQLQIQYSRLYDSSERDAIILTKKNQKIFGLQRKVKQLQRKMIERQSFQKRQQIQDDQVMGRRFSKNNNNNNRSVNNNSNDNLNVNNSYGEIEFKNRQEEQSILQPQQQQGTVIYDDIDESCLDQLQSQAHLQTDSQYLSQVSIHETQHQKLDTEIKNIQRTIRDRQAFYADINERQMDLEYKLIEEMKQEYHQKIRLLEKQRERLISSVNNGNNGNKRGQKLQDRGKIHSLQSQIKQLKKKAKQQKQLQKQVTTQSHRLRQLNEEITSFRMQKIELNRKMKQEKDKFNKFKNKRIKQLLDAKRQNAKKEGQIRKLRNQNKKHVQQAIKRKQEMKRMKKVNQTLKQLMKPKKLVRGSMSIMPQHGRGTDNKNFTMSTSVINPNQRRRGGNLRSESELVTSSSMSQDQYDQVVSESIKCLLIQIDRELQRQKIWQKCEQIQKQIDNLKQQQSELNIKKQRLQLKKQSRLICQQQVASYVELQRQQQQRIMLQQLTINLNQIQQRLVNLQEDMQFKSSRYQDLSTNNSSQKQYSHQTEIIYNKRYQSVQSFRCIIISLYRSIIRLLTENLHIKEQVDTYTYENGILEQELAQLKQKVYSLSVQCQQKIQQARQQYMQLKIQLQLQRQSRNNDLAELQNYSSIGNETTKLLQPYAQSSQFDKSQQQLLMKKKYQKKIQQLNRNNKQLIKQLQIQRKRCETVSDKYNSLKSLLNKDRFIGITVKEQETGYGNGYLGNNNGGNGNNMMQNNLNSNNNTFSSYRERRHESMIKQQHQQQKDNNLNPSNKSNNTPTNITANTNRLISQFSTIQQQPIISTLNNSNNNFNKTFPNNESNLNNINSNNNNNNNNISSSSQQFLTMMTQQKDRQGYNRHINNNKKLYYQQNHQQSSLNPSTTINTSNNREFYHHHSNYTTNNGCENFFIERRSTQDLQFNKNNWELAAEITNAHKSPILALAAHDNILASSASKSVALWDLQTNQLIHQFSGNPNPTFVRSLNIHPQRQIMFTTADRNINVYDLRTFKHQMTLKGHKDQIRLLHINQDTLFSAGKGTVNGGSLLVWDLRGSMSFENIVEKEKNQDIFSMTSQNGILYYGTRDHFVRRMKIQNNETLLPFQPPHMDTVTGLATFGDYLISGSKDKNLRLWSLQTSMFNLKSTVHSFNDYITCVQNDDYLPLFYASDRSGQIKIGTVIKEKIEFVGGILAHSQQINAICKLNASPRRGLFATGSSDKSIKLWRPSGQTLEHILNDY